MSTRHFPKDLVVLAADKNMEFAVKGILGRFRSLGIREITVDFRVHHWRCGSGAIRPMSTPFSAGKGENHR